VTCPRCALAIVVLLLSAAPRGSSALDPWTASDWRREGVVVALAMADITLTDAGLRLPDVYEANPVLGRRPSRAKLWGLGMSAAVGHVVVARLLPRRARDVWQAAGISVELTMCVSNSALLVAFHF